MDLFMVLASMEHTRILAEDCQKEMRRRGHTEYYDALAEVSILAAECLTELIEKIKPLTEEERNLLFSCDSEFDKLQDPYVKRICDAAENFLTAHTN